MSDPVPLLPTPPVAVARVAVDVGLAHLDRLFDYTVPEAVDAEAVPGSRVRVRFAGRLRDGFVLERVVVNPTERSLQPLHKVVSAEPVLSPEVARLVRAVADHWAGTFADVVRLAVPPRHAATEKAARRERTAPELAGWDTAASVLAGYPWGAGWLDAVAGGASPRAFWQVAPTAAGSGSWAEGFADAAAAAVRSGRGALAVVPDTHDLDLLERACRGRLGADAVVRLTADAGPSTRYRAFLAARRGDVPVVIGTRAAAFAPVQRLGLVALWDDGDDLHAEPRAPYPHARDVLAIRAAQSRAAVLVASHARSSEVQRWLEDGWLRPVQLAPREVRRACAAVRVAADSDRALERDPHAEVARLPHEVFQVVRAGLSRGPVLVQVPRAGQLLALLCADCRTPARCGHCSGRLETTTSQRTGTAPDGRAPARPLPSCRWCGRLQTDWRCEECGSSRWRAPVVGAARTAHELGRAFPHTRVVAATAGEARDPVRGEHVLVVATPGGEPPAEHGYAAAVLLDTTLLLGRPDLRAGEEALRRWLNVVALVRSGERDGTVIAVGPSDARTLQALVRIDPGGFAARELAERAEAHLGPAWRTVTVEGGAEPVRQLQGLLEPDRVEEAGVEVLGPVELETGPDGTPRHRLVLRSPPAGGPELVRQVRQAQSVRSARKSEGALRVKVDPVVFG